MPTSKVVILRRKLLGYVSGREIMNNMRQEHGLSDTHLIRHDRIGRRAARIGLRNLGRPYPDACEVLFRWGCTASYPGEITINKSWMIQAVNNKVNFRRKCMEAGVPLPKTFFDKDEAESFIGSTNSPPRGIYLIGRESYHAQGRRMSVIRNYEELQRDYRSDYWSEFIPKEKEFRYYTAFGRVIAVAEKIAGDREAIAWNHALGNSSFMNVRWNDWNLKAARAALEAQKAIGIDFGGVDIMTKGRNVYVLEMNSAPTLSTEYRQIVFARMFSWVVREFDRTGEKPEHASLPEDRSIGSYRDVALETILEGGE